MCVCACVCTGDRRVHACDQPQQLSLGQNPRGRGRAGAADPGTPRPAPDLATHGLRAGSPECLTCFLGQRSPTFEAPVPNFMEDSFSTDCGRGHIYCALCFQSKASTDPTGGTSSRPRGWGPLPRRFLHSKTRTLLEGLGKKTDVHFLLLDVCRNFVI